MSLLIENVSQNKEKWMELRKGKIGASSAYDAADIDEGSNPLRVWENLIRQGDWAEKDSSNGWSKWGLRLESAIGEGFAEDYAAETGSKVEIVGGDALYQHDKYPFAVATPDFLMKIDGELVNVQVKTRSASRYSEYLDGKLPNSDRAQVLHELGVLSQLGIRRGFLASFFYPGFVQGVREPSLIWREVHREDEYVDELFKREQKLVEMAQRGEAPPVKIPGQAARNRFWECDDSTLDLTGNEDFEFTCREYIRLKIEEATVSKAKKKLAVQALEFIKTAKKGFSGDYKVNVVRTEKTLFDVNRFKTIHPELFKKFTYKSKSIFPLITGPSSEAAVELEHEDLG